MFQFDNNFGTTNRMMRDCAVALICSWPSGYSVPRSRKTWFDSLAESDEKIL